LSKEAKQLILINKTEESSQISKIIWLNYPSENRNLCPTIASCKNSFLTFKLSSKKDLPIIKKYNPSLSGSRMWKIMIRSYLKSYSISKGKNMKLSFAGIWSRKDPNDIKSDNFWRKVRVIHRIPIASDS
jgi:hypothetical protein